MDDVEEAPRLGSKAKDGTQKTLHLTFNVAKTIMLCGGLPIATAPGAVEPYRVSALVARSRRKARACDDFRVPKNRAPADVVLRCLRRDAVFKTKDGTITKPMLVGFAEAAVLDKISKAPSFSEDESDLLIAERLKSPPVTKWQRPLDKVRVALMTALFSREPHLMPNPVLLAANPERVGKVRIAHDRGMSIVTITPTSDALWILDGQHRIAALAGSTQRDNPIPFVLLHDQSGAYERAEFAELFAEVTTAAKALEEPHRTWLEYSFHLGDYAIGRHGSDARTKAFETVVLLGALEAVDAPRTKNYFAGNVRFNPKTKLTDLGVDGVKGAFAFSAEELADLVYKHYFHYPALGQLKPRALASEIAHAFAALRKVVTRDAAFLQPDNLYVQEGFLVGILTHLRKLGAPAAWADVLHTTKLDVSDWVFPPGLTTGGQAGNHSRRAANGVFAQAFAVGHPPPGVDDLASYLLGNSGTVIKLMFTDSTGRETVKDFPPATEVLSLADYLKPGSTLKIQTSPNIGYLSVEVSSRGTLFAKQLTRGVKTGKGFLLDDLADDRVRLPRSELVAMTLRYEHYGGRTNKRTIEFK